MYNSSNFVAASILMTFLMSCAVDQYESDNDELADGVGENVIQSMSVSTDTQLVFDILEKRQQSSGQNFIDCMEVDEIENTHLCVSTTASFMEQALLRASISIEGPNDITVGTILSLDSPEYKNTIGQFGGFDLKGQALLDFWAGVLNECRRDAAFCPNDVESEFFESFVIPRFQHDPNFVVITVPLDLEFRTDILAHEILHAQYFLEPGFSDVVDSFWDDEVAVLHKDSVIDILDDSYDVNDPILLRNEFQAYLLMTGAEYYDLHGWVASYAEPLRERLEATGHTPILVK